MKRKSSIHAGDEAVKRLVKHSTLVGERLTTPEWRISHYNAGEPEEFWSVFQYGHGEWASCTSYAAAEAALRLFGGVEELRAYETYMIGLVGPAEFELRKSSRF